MRDCVGNVLNSVIDVLRTALQLSRQHQLLEQENLALKEEEKICRHELRKFRDGLVERKEVSSWVDVDNKIIQ